MSKIYAGIGHTEIPLDIEILMYEIGIRLAQEGWTLRSGGAKGSDKAFEKGCDEVKGSKEIFYPKNVPIDIIDYSLKFHPKPHKVKTKFGRNAMGRNAQIILGENLKVPVQRVIGYCEYDQDNNWTGGTSHGFRISSHFKIPIYNLFHEDIKQMFLRKLMK